MDGLHWIYIHIYIYLYADSALEQHQHSAVESVPVETTHYLHYSTPLYCLFCSTLLLSTLLHSSVSHCMPSHMTTARQLATTRSKEEESNV